MRGFLTFISFFLFFLIFPLAIFAYSINTVLNPGYIKEQLVKSKIYEAVSKSAPTLIKLPQEEAPPPEEVQKAFEGFLAKEITANYLQKKTEPVIDATFAWLTGKTEATPSINLSDLNEKIEVFAKEKNYPLPQEIRKPLSEPIKLKPTAEQLRVRKVFQITLAAPLVLAAASGLLLLLIFWLAESWKSKLRKLSLALFVPAILGLPTTLALAFLFAVITGLVTDQFKGPEFAQLGDSIKGLISLVSTNFLKTLLIMYGSSLLVSLLLFIVSFFVGNKRKTTAEIPIKPPGQKPT
ncbi:MAG TPA: hypothetical protein VF303_04415 [Candidatus Nanoarchaeia archaeon]